MERQIKKTIRLTNQEFKKVEYFLNLENVNFSDFTRAKILNHKIKNLNELEKINQIKKIGNNINQIAKKLNQNDFKNELNLLIQLKKISENLEKI